VLEISENVLPTDYKVASPQPRQHPRQQQPFSTESGKGGPCPV